MSNRAWIILALSLVACGDDEDDAPPRPANPGAAAARPPAAAGGATITPQVHVEDRVPPAERASVRHHFSERDFVAGPADLPLNRDPFQSYTIIQPGLIGPNSDSKRDLTPICTDPKQMVAKTHSYVDLHLVGIVAEGTQRKVLMTDNSRGGYIIRRGDCVGREKALVKDVGAAYVTFELQSEASGARAEERSIQLYPDRLALTPGEEAEERPVGGPNAPVVSPTDAPRRPRGGGPGAPPGAPDGRVLRPHDDRATSTPQ